MLLQHQHLRGVCDNLELGKGISNLCFISSVIFIYEVEHPTSSPMYNVLIFIYKANDYAPSNMKK